MATARRNEAKRKRTPGAADEPSTHTFTARVEPIAMGVPFHVVEVPPDVSAAFGKGRVHVVATVKGTEVQTSLSPKKGGRHQMFLSRQVREMAGIRTGERVKITLARAAAPREEPVPADLLRALRDAGALDAFERVARSTRNALMVWLDEARTETTREKRVERIVERGLEAREKEIDREAARLARAPRT